MHDPHGHVADPKRFAIPEQMVELRAVGGEGLLKVEDLLEYPLHLGDVRADADPAAERRLQVRRGREVVGMGVGLEDPVDRETLFAHERDDPVGRRSEEHTSELQSLMRISYAVFCWTKKKKITTYHRKHTHNLQK